METRHASSARPGAGRPPESAPTSVLGRVCAPGRVVLPQPLHHVLDPPELLLDLPVEHLVLKQPESRSKDAATEECPGGSIPTLSRTHTSLQHTLPHGQPLSLQPPRLWEKRALSSQQRALLSTRVTSEPRARTGPSGPAPTQGRSVALERPPL